MSRYRIALANLRAPATPDESVVLATQAIREAATHGARIVAYPECYVPGYRGLGRTVPPPDERFLERAWSEIAHTAAHCRIAVVLGTERVLDGRLHASALVIDEHGRRMGFQDKVQIDPSEEGTYAPAEGRAVFDVAGVTIGVVICHEGWRYPETVRWAARRGASIVFHPHMHVAEPGSCRPSTFADPANSFHEKAVLCRAAENGCYVASVNCASDGSPTTSAVAGPDGTVRDWQPYGQEGLLISDLDLDQATRLLAMRCRSTG